MRRKILWQVLLHTWLATKCWRPIPLSAKKLKIKSYKGSVLVETLQALCSSKLISSHVLATEFANGKVLFVIAEAAISVPTARWLLVR